MPAKRTIPRTCAQCGTQFLTDLRTIAIGEGRFCSRACSARSTRRPAEERFWPKVLITEGCWLWQGACSRYGYGRFGLEGKRGGTVWAHRFVWEILRGPIPDGMEVCHDCPGGDNPRCVNPDHLFLGSHATNMADMAKKDRAARGRDLPQAKLSPEDVIAIRQSHAAREGSYATLAERYGVSDGTILRVVRRIDWRHV